MKRLIFLSVILLILNSLTFTNTYAQVTIGMSEAPLKGALLQLKSRKDNSNLTNANQGLGLPRVELTSISDLFPMFPVGYDKSAQDKIHTGLIVYNVNEDLKDGDGKGIYYWDGEKWYPLNPIKKEISITPNVVTLSELNPTMTVNVKTTPENAAYYISHTKGEDCATISNATNRGDSDDLLFQKNGENYGTKEITYKLENTDKTASLTVNHIHLEAKELLKLGDGANISSETIVQAKGGRGKWFIKDYSRNGFNWKEAPQNREGFLSFELGEAIKEGNNIGFITVAHIDDPNYTKTINIQQNKKYITLPEFDYLVIQYLYKKQGTDKVDLDIATVITGTGLENQRLTNNGVDNNPSGWNVGVDYNKSPRIAKNIEFMYWGGDNRNSGYETVYVNMTNLRDSILDNTAPREFYINTYATWYNPNLSKNLNNTIAVKFTLYKGGKMQKYNTYDFINVGGKEKPVFEIIQENLPVTTYKGVENYETNYTKLLRLEYDRIDNTGVLVPFESVMTRSNIINYHLGFPSNGQLPNESKDSYAERCEEYRKILYNSLIKNSSSQQKK